MHSSLGADSNYWLLCSVFSGEWWNSVLLPIPSTYSLIHSVIRSCLTRYTVVVLKNNLFWDMNLAFRLSWLLLHSWVETIILSKYRTFSSRLQSLPSGSPQSEPQILRLRRNKNLFLIFGLVILETKCRMFQIVTLYDWLCVLFLPVQN
jgi:hypothetical protein